MDTTYDGLLNHQLQIRQPKAGFRIAVDTVLLAAAVPAGSGQIVLDMGCGVGGALLCLALRVPGVILTGVDIQAELIDLCQENIRHNGFAERATAYSRSVHQLPDEWQGRFDHVMMNPPYHDGRHHDASLNDIKRIANTEIADDLEKWLVSADRVLSDKGVLTLIHRADRWPDIAAILSTKFKRIDRLPIVPKAGAGAKRIIIRAAKTGEGQHVYSPFVLHEAHGSYTEQADKILRSAEALSFIE